jgi:hypothetical protein
MARLAALAVALAALVGPALAQMRQNDVTVRWYWADGCSGDPHTTVIVMQGYQQVVPNAVRFPFYRVACAADASGSGTIEYCADASCSAAAASISLPFAANTCLPNDRAAFGNAGVTVECPAPGTGDIVVPEVEFLGDQAAELNWFELEGCGSRPGG